MTSEMNAIQIENLSKKYEISHQPKKQPQTLRELLTWSRNKKNQDPSSDAAALTTETFWALRDISFSVSEGERIAIIGGNGAGKSTLLKILSRITEPTEGKVKIRGKVSSLLEVGTGFHPELTGRENIFLNGAILGMRRSEIKAKFDQIVAFSGVEKFIDTPVKHYSSGMYVRLAFSVSAWLDPDILIVDEVLSVGDQAFQRRCAERMKELTGAGRTVLFVSHSMQAVKTMCEKALLLDKGRAVSFESVDEVASKYIRSLDSDSAKNWGRASFSPGDEGVLEHCHNHGKIQCLYAAVVNSEGEVTSSLSIDEGFFINLTYEVLGNLDNAAVPNIHFYDEFGARFFIALPETTCPIERGTYTVKCLIPPYIFNNGRYTAMVAVSSYALEFPLHFAYEDALRFEVLEQGLIDPRRHGWTGELPGMSRPRLNWEYSKQNQTSTQRQMK